MLIKLRPKAHQSYRTLPILGPIVDEFTDWIQRCGYSMKAFGPLLSNVRHLALFFHRRGLRKLAELNQDHFQAAWERLHRQNSTRGGMVRQVERYLQEVHGLVPPPKRSATRSEATMELYGQHLQKERGFADHTIASHRSCLRVFLRFLGYDRSRSALTKLTTRRVEEFVEGQAKICNRQSLQHVVGYLRSFLRFQYSRGKLDQPLHTSIDTPKVYRLEQLPKALPWPQVQALLQSIDRRDARGLRDYTMLYLMAAYGLRCSEVVALTLEDVDWRAGSLQVAQRKTRNALVLPLTNEAGDILQRYLKHGRRPTERREIFLRANAPFGALASTSIHDILNYRIGRSGLSIGQQGTHALRHALAIRLMRQGVPMKTIGDTLGHRSLDSTAVYLRLSIEDLRQVGLPVPVMMTSVVSLAPGWKSRLPRIRRSGGLIHHGPVRFKSGLAVALQRYLVTKQALGRAFTNETRILGDWDAFLCQHRPDAKRINPDCFSGWATTLVHLNPTVRRYRLRVVRNFLIFYSREHPTTWIPDLATLPKPVPPGLPRLVSTEEMARVLGAAAKLEPSTVNPFRAQTVRMALLLLFCCGLRRGELSRLRLSHFDGDQNLLRIEGTKFHKSRLVPLSTSLAIEVRDYLAFRRSRHRGGEDDAFLWWTSQRPRLLGSYTANGLVNNWQQLCLAVGVVDGRGRPPRLHDLRHAFIIGALTRWYEQRVDVQAMLPHLSAYVGHASPLSTHYYLQLTPPLGQAASQRFHQACRSLLERGGRL
jgi:site-specific recombinase XerD